MPQPRLIFLAGPNGAGKSTFYSLHLAQLGLTFVNADNLTRNANIPNSEAAKAADKLRAQLLEDSESFISETVFSDEVGAKLAFLHDAIDHGYDVTLIYIGLESVELSEARIAQRVDEGGHDVPSDKLPRRYEQSLKNLAATLQFLPTIFAYDNSQRDRSFRLVLKWERSLLDTPEPKPEWIKRVLDY